MTEGAEGILAALDRFAAGLADQDLAATIATLHETDPNLTVIPSEVASDDR